MLDKNHCFLIFLVFILPGCSFLKSEEEQRLYKINQVWTLHQRERNVFNDSSLILLEEAASIIKSINDSPDSLIIENNFRRGYYYANVKNNKDSALFYYQKTIDSIRLEDDRTRNDIYFRNAWETYFEAEQFKNSAAIAQTYLGKPPTAQTKPGLMYAYNNLERISYALGDLEAALRYNEKVLQLALELGDNHEGMYVLEYIGWIGLLGYLRDDPNEKLKLYDSLVVLEEDLKPGINRYLFSKRGILYFELGNYQKAISDYKTSAYYARFTADSSAYFEELAICYANIAEGYKFLENYDLAVEYIDSTFFVANKIEGVKSSSSEIISFATEQRLEIAYLRKEDVGEIAETLKVWRTLQSEIHLARMNEELNSFKALINSNKEKDIKNAKLNQQKVFLIASVIILLLLVIIGVLFYYQRKLRFQKKGLQMQQRLLRSQMNPHFIYNTLYAIQNLIVQDQERASEYLVKFSRLLRLALENSTLDYIELETEVETLKKYLDLQLLRLPGRFSYQIELKNIEESDLLFIPPMLIQPFVENSIEHGFNGIDYQGKLNISLTKSDKFILCEIIDNGNGLSQNEKPGKKSLSSDLISSFIEKSTYQKVQIANLNDENSDKKGVSVMFSILYKYSEYD